MTHALTALDRATGIPFLAYTSAARLWRGAVVVAGGLLALFARLA